MAPAREAKKTVSIGFLNVVATPHPDGIYITSLRRLVNKPINFYGNEYAVVLKPSRVKRDAQLHEGILRVWTDIDGAQPSINKKTFEPEANDAALLEIFAARGFNNRGFYYVLDEANHTLTCELVNEGGQRISVNQLQKIFSLAFSRLNKEGQTYTVTAIPLEDAISSVLDLKRLDQVKIFLKRPNPGDHDGGDAAEVLRELEEQNMREADYIFTRQPGTDGINLNAKNDARASVAAVNGHVESRGLDDDGKRVRRSTQEYPKIVNRAVAIGTIVLSVLLSEARRQRGAQ